MRIEAADHRVPSGRAGLTLLVRNKHAVGLGTVGPERTVLFVHGATYASTVTFDYPVDDVSWMDRLAQAGFDVWCVDLLGYGGADHPPEMDQPAEANEAIVDTAEAEAQTVRVVDFIRRQRGLKRICLIGYSWGTTICGGIASRRPELVERLVLSGVLWTRVEAGHVAGGGLPGAYRTVDAAATVTRGYTGLRPEQKAEAFAPGLIERWARDAVASDPGSARHDPPRLRAPAGVVKDVLKHWLADDPTYDPTRIEAPTLAVVGEWDNETRPDGARAVFDRLERAADRRLVLIGRTTHNGFLGHYRHALHRTVEAFLKEGWR